MVVVAATLMASTASGQGVVQDDYSPIPTCDRQLPSPVEALVRPVLQTRAAALQAKREWDTAYEDAFYRLLKMRSPVAREAQAALMAYYTGEHYGEELLELAKTKPQVSDPPVAKYRICRPKVAFEDQLQGVVVLRTLYELYENDRAGK
jgi:hypothetical protein